MKDFLTKLRFFNRLAIAIVLVVLRTRELRRKLMFAVSILVMLLTFTGVVLLEDFLSEHLWLFAGYWFVTTGLVVFLLLLAFYDMLRVRFELSEGRLKSLRDLEKFVKEIKEKDDTRD